MVKILTLHRFKWIETHGIKIINKYTGQRGLVLVSRDSLWSGKPEKTLTVDLSKSGGRNNKEE